MPNITLNSIQYFYQSQGTRSETNPALVLLHGSGGDSSVWTAQIEALSENHHVIAPDLPGHGQSQGKPAREPQEYANWLKLLTESLKLSSFVLAGHSLGGSIAQQFAHMFPDSLRGLILIGSGMSFDIPSEYLAMLRQDFDAACTLSSQQAYAAPMPTAMLENGRNMLRRNGPETLLRDLLFCGDFDSTAWAHTITMPCLVMCGEQDAITPYSLSQQLIHVLPNSILKSIHAAGHMVMQEQPNLFNKEVSLFIKKRCGENAY